MNSQTALILIDAQLNMFDPKNPVHDSEALLERLQKLLALSRASGTQVIFIQNSGQAGDPDEPRTEGWLIHPELGIENGDLIVQKHENDAFAATPLEEKLKARGIRKLIIAGLQSEYCVAANCRKAHELGFEVVLVSDAHSTYKSKDKSAEEIIAAVNESLRGKVTFWHVDDILT